MYREPLLKLLGWTLSSFNVLRWTVSIPTVDWVFREPLLKLLLGWTLSMLYVGLGVQRATVDMLTVQRRALKESSLAVGLQQ